MSPIPSYIGEQLGWGKAGHLLSALALGSAFLSFLLYWKSETWRELKRWARGAFVLHGLSLVGLLGIILYLMLHHRFEYHYVWQHTNTAMEPRFILSALWEGQEGSFLLWMLWHAVIGILVMRLGGCHEHRVMWVLSLAQTFLATMILGIQFLVNGQEIIIGSDLFTLTREHPAMRNVPLFFRPDYLKRLDGRGLNPLLQNYWMTIHPPVLFLGFAATVVPYAFVVGSLRSNDWETWIRPVRPWAFLALGLLGAGILMGAAWAYEALSFGGFWAWDPVENASLVPWLALVAGVHLLLIPRTAGLNLFLAVCLLVGSFVLVLWSTFLTRSGILGDSSVHSFTDLGMTAQLLLYVGFFAWLPAALILHHSSFRWFNLLFPAIPLLFFGVWGTEAVWTRLVFLAGVAVLIGLTLVAVRRRLSGWKSSEPLLSRDMWMFTGSLVLALSWFHIIHETSRPALGKAFRGLGILEKLYPANYAPPSDIIDRYNYVEGLLGGAILLLMGATQFLRYRETPWRPFLRQMAAAATIAVGLTIGVALLVPIRSKFHYLLLLFTALFSVVANGLYAWKVARFKLRASVASLAHIGFGLLLAGAVIAGGYKTIVSSNYRELINLETLNKNFKNSENMLLHKGDTIPMKDYRVVYFRDSVEAPRVYFGVKFFNREGQELFTLWPQVQTNPRMGDVAEPATRHGLGRDLYTHVSYVDKAKLNFLLQPADTNNSTGLRDIGTFSMQQGDSVQLTNSLVIFSSLKSKQPLDSLDIPARLELEGLFTVIGYNGTLSTVKPTILIENNTFQSFPASCPNTGIRIEVKRILPQERRLEVHLSQPVINPKDDFIILQVILFPGVNLLWSGAALMTLGLLLAAYLRFSKDFSSA
ncbi:MAG: cytochrome c biogenesis protein CcsA [Flavobacteriales bacterium]|nr:cytochrome c biogenesis protein CcsA [Flavobacteriales bacterium]MCX7768610.1 cytochrome c biogenesis protein CcsA [Flavobacteriales bacterium]MDW8409737.1 cytochrome c biogenesis protein CcsA [Flavobacteriales bacterium]